MTRGRSAAIADSADWVDLAIGAEGRSTRAVTEVPVRSEADATHAVGLSRSVDVLAAPATPSALEAIVSALRTTVPRSADAAAPPARSLRDALGLSRPASRFARVE